MKTSVTYQITQNSYDEAKYGLIPLTICELYDIDENCRWESYGKGWSAFYGLRMLQHDLLEHWHEGYGTCKGDRMGNYLGEVIALGAFQYFRQTTGLDGDVSSDIVDLIADLCEDQKSGNYLEERFVPKPPKATDLEFYGIASDAIGKTLAFYTKLPKGCTIDRIARWLSYGYNLAVKRYAYDYDSMANLLKDIKKLDSLFNEDGSSMKLLKGAKLTLHTLSNLDKQTFTYSLDIEPKYGKSFIGLKNLDRIDLYDFLEFKDDE